jgi:hypothetical protein
MSPEVMLSRLNLCGDALPAQIRSAFWALSVKVAHREELTRGELDALEHAYVEIVGPQDARRQETDAAVADRLAWLLQDAWDQQEHEGRKKAKAGRRPKRQVSATHEAVALSEPNARCSCGAFADACHWSGHAARMGGVE